ncbi:thioredoxin-like protein [Aspergillus floccosus]
MPVREVNTFKEFQDIINKDTPSVFDFWADGCGSCKAISPQFEHLAEDTKGPEFYKVNVEKVPDAAHEVGITAMPTFVTFKNGAKMDEFIGAEPHRLQALVEGAAKM